MALWQILDKSGAPSSTWDDGLKFMPGEEGFARPGKAKAPYGANYIGTPNWEPPKGEDDE